MFAITGSKSFKQHFIRHNWRDGIEIAGFGSTLADKLWQLWSSCWREVVKCSVQERLIKLNEMSWYLIGHTFEVIPYSCDLIMKKVFKIGAQFQLRIAYGWSLSALRCTRQSSILNRVLWFEAFFNKTEENSLFWQISPNLSYAGMPNKQFSVNLEWWFSPILAHSCKQWMTIVGVKSRRKWL